MTINIADNSPRISYSVAEGVTQTSFAVPFEFFDNPDLNVYIDGTLKTITTDYTVSGGDGSTGTVTMSVTGASGGSTVVITRDIELERTTDFPVSGSFNIVALNTELDRLVAIAADLEDRSARAIQAQDFDSTVSYTLPVVDDRKGKVLGFNATTGAVEAGPEIAATESLAAVSADIALLADIEDGTLDTNAITNVNGIRTDVTTVSGISGNVTTVASNDANVTTVATNLSGSDTIGTVAGSIANVNLTGGSISSVNTVAGSISNVNTTATNIADVNTVAGVSTDVSTVAGISSNVSTVSGISANVTTVAGISSNVTTVAGISGNVTTVAGQTTNLQNVTDNLTAIQNAATNATNAATSASNAATSATAAAASQTAAAASAASAASSYDSFDDRYLGVKASDPTVDNDGDPLSSGLLYFSSSENIMKVYDGASWIAATSAGNVSLTTYQYTATGGQTTFSGSDDNAATLTYTVNNILVTLNGSLLFNGTDYTAINGTSIVLTSGATASDVLQVTAFASFTTADMVPASTGGTFSGNVDVQGTLTSDGLTVQSNNYLDILDADNHVSGRLRNVSGSNNALTIEADPANSASGTFMSFKIDATERMRIDSSGNLILKATSDTGNRLQINGADETSELLEVGITSGHAQFTATHASGGSNTAGFIFRTRNGTAGTTEKMRIDSSGNLLVGKTSSSFSTVGARLSSTDNQFVTDGQLSAAFNRKTSDGDIIGFFKDGTTVGSIGTLFGDLYAATGNTGIRFVDANRSVSPYDSNASALVDAAVDLGYASARYKDLYLSGGVYLGGTGSANKLDDYEEGTFTPSLSSGYSSASYYDQVGRYTKIGNTVRAFFRINLSSATALGTNVQISGFPFTSTNSSSPYITATHYINTSSANGDAVKPIMFPNGTTVHLYYQGTGGVTGLTGTNLGTGLDIIAQVVYETA